jgi:hypothetical protein
MLRAEIMDLDYPGWGGPRFNTRGLKLGYMGDWHMTARRRE